MEDSYEGVRLAGVEDEEAIFDHLMQLYRENAIFSMSPAKVLASIKKATNQQGGFIGIIDAPDGSIAGTIGLYLDSFWYTDDWYVGEVWNFVHPDHRRGENAKLLIGFAKWIAEKMGLSLMMGIMSTNRTEAKMRLYDRELTYVGGFFMHNIELPEGAVTRRMEIFNRGPRRAQQTHVRA